MTTTPVVLQNSKAHVPGKVRTYTGYYKFVNSAPLTRGFELSGNLKEAKERFIKHCLTMGYKYIGVVPMVVDLEYIEKRRNESDFDDVNDL